MSVTNIAIAEARREKLKTPIEIISMNTNLDFSKLYSVSPKAQKSDICTL